MDGLEESNGLTYYQPFKINYSFVSWKKYVTIGDWIRILMSKERKCKEKVENQNKQIIFFALK